MMSSQSNEDFPLALAAAIATMEAPKKDDDSSTVTEEERAPKRSKTANENPGEETPNESSKSNDNPQDDDEDTFDTLLAAWKHEESPEIKIQAFKVLMEHCTKELEWLIRTGIESSQLCASLESQVGQLQHELQAKEDQLKSLGEIKADQAKTIQVREQEHTAMDSFSLTIPHSLQNLINSQSNHQTQILEQASTITVCSNLRAELNHVVSDRDQGAAKLAEMQRTTELLQNEIRELKLRLSRMSNEKMRIEREYQSTQRLYKSQSNNEKVDFDYYKRKVSELNGRVQSLQIALNEKDRQLGELRGKEF